MSKNCRIEFVEGELTRLCNHRDYRNCDLYEEFKKWYENNRGEFASWLLHKHKYFMKRTFKCQAGVNKMIDDDIKNLRREIKEEKE